MDFVLDNPTLQVSACTYLGGCARQQCSVGEGWGGGGGQRHARCGRCRPPPHPHFFTASHALWLPARRTSTGTYCLM